MRKSLSKFHQNSFQFTNLAFSQFNPISFKGVQSSPISFKSVQSSPSI